MLRIAAPQGVSLDYTTQQIRAIERLIQPLRDSGEIDGTFASAGQGNQNSNGFMVLSLAPWDKRERSQQDIVAELNRLMRQVPGAAHHAGAAEQPRHPRRRQRPAIRHRRQQLPAARRCGEQDSRGDGKGSALPAGRASAATRRSRSSPSPSTANAPPTSASTFRACPERCRRCSTATRSARCSSTTAATR